MTEEALATFDTLPLSNEVKRALSELGYVNPTPVQRAVFGPAVEGKNLVVQARTGTGKTAAFALPLVDGLLRRAVPGVQALVLTPTRELAIQVAGEIRKLGVHRDVKVSAIYGGAPMQAQIDELSRHPNIVVGTPGRVLDHLRRGTFDASHVRVFVLDEADEMLSMGFARELNAIVECLPKQRQGLFFSATIPPDIERMAHAKLQDPEFIALSSDQAGALTIQHYVYVVRERKHHALLSVVEVENPESAVVFCNTKDETERVAETLKNAGYEADWLNGDLEQKERERVMKSTREGKLRFLVATDVAARGIDISHLTHVINFDFPESAENYLHRTGRTGRAGRTGTAISLIAPRDVGNLYLLRLSYKIRPIEKQLPTSSELKSRAELDAVDVLVEAYAQRPVDDDARAIARRLLTHDDVEGVLAHLVRAHLGERPEEAKERAAEARRAKPPRPIEEPVTQRAAEARPATARPEPGTNGESPPTRAASPRREREARPPRRPRAERRPLDQDDDAPRIGWTEGPAVAAPVATSRAAESLEGAATEPATVTDSGEAPSEQAPRAERRPPREIVVPEGQARLYVNVGRRDGVTRADLEALLTEAGCSGVGSIELRDRMTFLTVEVDAAAGAIEALGGRSLGGRTLIAELARPRG